MLLLVPTSFIVLDSPFQSIPSFISCHSFLLVNLLRYCLSVFWPLSVPLPVFSPQCCGEQHWPSLVSRKGYNTMVLLHESFCVAWQSVPGSTSEAGALTWITVGECCCWKPSPAAVQPELPEYPEQGRGSGQEPTAVVWEGMRCLREEEAPQTGVEMVAYWRQLNSGDLSQRGLCLRAVELKSPKLRKY